jgi:uncharacterized SAM-dependent methyltransferase
VAEAVGLLRRMAAVLGAGSLLLIGIDRIKDVSILLPENSFKYGPRDASVLLRAGGWTPIANWTDPQESFSLILATGSREMN